LNAIFPSLLVELKFEGWTENCTDKLIKVATFTVCYSLYDHVICLISGHIILRKLLNYVLSPEKLLIHENTVNFLLYIIQLTWNLTNHYIIWFIRHSGTHNSHYLLRLVSWQQWSPKKKGSNGQYVTLPFYADTRTTKSIKPEYQFFLYFASSCSCSHSMRWKNKHNMIFRTNFSIVFVIFFFLCSPS
jgi:hypothetical protein